MIKILICDDQVIVCEGLKRILETDPLIEVVGSVNDGLESLDFLKQTSVDLVLMDLKMPVMNGVIATRKIQQSFPQVRILVLTTYDDDEWVFDAIRAGASGYLLKDMPPKALLEAIHGTLAGKSYVDPNVTGKLLNNIAHQPRLELQATSFNLSEREKEVLKMMCQGFTNADIARQLYLTEGTVRNYTSDIFRKLGVSDRTQAVVMGLRHGLLDSI
ncbi:MAG: response regulator transcription factor [Chloroflexota bacterium]|jgi:DNA-binding NarL/FixJ family response regulator